MGSFETISDVEAWARQHGGLAAVNEALARGTFGSNAQSIRTAIRYVEREELKIAEKLDRGSRRNQAFDTAEAFSRAAERSAAAASVYRWVALAAALVAVLAAVITVTFGRSPF